MGEIVARNI